MKRALFITLTAPPHRNVGTDRILRFIKHLQKFDWSGDILSADSRKIAMYDASTLKKIPKGTRIYHTRLLKIFLPVSAIMRILSKSWYNYMISAIFMVPDAFIGWVPFLLSKGKKLLLDNRNSYDIMISSSPPHSMHLACLALKKKFAIPWIVDFRDPWVDHPSLQGLMNIHRKFHAFLEAVVVKNCDAVIANTEKNAGMLCKRYPAESKKITCINNGYDSDDFGGIETKNDRNNMTFFYGGILYPQYDPEPLFRGIAEAIRKRPDIRKRISVKFVGSKSERKRIYRYGLDDIVIEEPPVSQDGFFTQLKNSDVAVLILNPLNKKVDCSYWVPAKLYQYLGAEKPILGVVPDGDAREILIESRLGNACYPDDIRSISETIIKLFDSWAADDLSCCVSESVKRFEASKQTKDLTELLNSVVLKKDD